MKKVYGYCRISRKTQNIERQERNILGKYPKAHIVKEAFTGRKIDRPQWSKLYKQIMREVEKGNEVTLIFDSVSRMSRDADEGVKTYFGLYDLGVNLVFLKEGYIDTETYKNAIGQTIAKTGNEIADCYISATNEVIRILAKQQIEKAFEQAQKEVDDLRQRTIEGIETARLAGKQIGQKDGAKFKIKKKEPLKEKIKQMSKDFDGNMTDKQILEVLPLSRNTYYKYKKELLADAQ